MARARNIKPSFFTNDQLGECDPLARLLFAGLWTIADRAGRLHDRPKKIKVEILPYDNCDIELLLSQLEKQGFILRYCLSESKYIQILNFQKHQNPHVKEGASTIPAPDKPHTSMVQNVPLPPSPILIPPSPIISPDEEISFEYEVIAKNAGLDKSTSDKEYQKFKNHYSAKPDKRITDYKPLWQNWCINTKDKNGTTKQYNKPTRQSVTDHVIEALAAVKRGEI